MTDFQVFDTTTNKTQAVDGTVLRLGRVGLSEQSNDNLVVIASTDNVDITTGLGNDVIIGHGGIMFINPGGGDNVMVGGSGQNDYVLNVTTAGMTHNLISNLHVGDQVTFQNMPGAGFQVGFDDIVSSLGPALRITVERVTDLANPLFTLDLPGLQRTDFSDDVSKTRLTFDEQTLRFVR